MDRFIRDMNLARFRRLLLQTQDEGQRRQLEQLITEEEAKKNRDEKKEE